MFDRAILVVCLYHKIDIPTAVLVFFVANLLFFLVIYVLFKVSQILERGFRVDEFNNNPSVIVFLAMVQGTTNLVGSSATFYHFCCVGCGILLLQGCSCH